MQVLFSWGCPAFCSGLSPFMRLLYLAGTWSYLCAAITTPLFVSVPILAVLTGVFPIGLNFQFAASFSVYFTLMISGTEPTAKEFAVGPLLHFNKFQI